MKANNLACPIDGESLEHSDKQLTCINGHSFDIARQGYVNLLPVQHKRSKHPGDSKAMVLARTRFLNTGVYLPIAEQLATTLAVKLPKNGHFSCVDAGCGEGYYLNTIADHFKVNHTGIVPSFIGLDISKSAIHEAAKRNKSINWVVGTNRQPPILKESVDLIVCVFGFQSFKGFNKILRLGGQIILVEPGPEHLKELREIAYSKIKETEPTSLAGALNEGFKLVSEKMLHFKTAAIANAPLNDLLMMTPHFFRASKEGKDAAAKLDSLCLSVDIVFRTLEKTEGRDLST